MSQQKLQFVDADIHKTYNTLVSQCSHLRGEQLIQAIFDLNIFKSEQMVCTSSFGADAAVLLKLISNVDNTVPIAFLDTHKHFNETIIYKDYLTAELGLSNVVDLFPNAAEVSTLEAGKSTELYDEWLQASQNNRDKCCAIRKHEPLERALENKKIWFTGRKQNNDTYRQDIPLFQIENGIIKANPIKDFTPTDIEEFYKDHNLARHLLFAEGYESIGCEPCTNAGTGRQGRKQKYCGMHEDERTPK